MTLTEFLEARIKEDELAACRAAGMSGEWSEAWGMGTYPTECGPAPTGVVGRDTPVGRHIARHDPARVLAECEAKRLIVNRALILDEQASTTPGNGTLNASFEGQALAYRVSLRFLALPYAAHPDYLPEWGA